MIYGDTSFLFSLYAEDANSAKADRLYHSDRRRPLVLTPWQRFEFRNAVRLAAHEFIRSKKPVPFNIGNVLKQQDDDLKSGVLRHVEPDWRDTFKLAEQISAAHTEAHGQGGVDTWHIAAALICRADSFWTFDKEQAETALAFGGFKRVMSG